MVEVGVVLLPAAAAAAEEEEEKEEEVAVDDVVRTMGLAEDRGGDIGRGVAVCPALPTVREGAVTIPPPNRGNAEEVEKFGVRSEEDKPNRRSCGMGEEEDGCAHCRRAISAPSSLSSSAGWWLLCEEG